MERNMDQQLIDIPISKVRINGRHRKDLGDIDGLAASIESVGLLHPIVLKSDHTLVAGERRLTAFKKLGRKSIPATIVESLSDALKALKAELDENAWRKDYLPSEAVSVGKSIESLEEIAAQGRRNGSIKTRDSRGRAIPSGGNLPPLDRGKTRDKVGAAVGMSGKQYEKAKSVIKAAEDKPKTFGKFVKIMDEKSVDAAYRGIQLEKTRQALGNPKELPDAEDSDAVRAILNDPTADALTFIRHLRVFVADASKEYERINFDLADWREPFFKRTYELVCVDMVKVQKVLENALEKVRSGKKWSKD